MLVPHITQKIGLFNIFFLFFVAKKDSYHIHSFYMEFVSKCHLVNKNCKNSKTEIFNKKPGPYKNCIPVITNSEQLFYEKFQKP